EYPARSGTEFDSQLSCREKVVALERYSLDALDRFGKRHRANRLPLKCNHGAKFAAVDAAYRGGSESQGETAVVGDRRAPALDLPEHECPRFLPRALLDLRGQPLREPSIASLRVCVARRFARRIGPF